MTRLTFSKTSPLTFNGLMALGALIVGLGAVPATAADLAPEVKAPQPALIISNQPLPADLAAQIYSHPSKAADVSPQKILGETSAAFDG